MGAYVLPVAYGFVKFRTLTSYHTRGAVISAYLVGAATILIFAGGSAWLFRLAALVLALAELEEMAITTVLPKPVTNVKDFRAALRLARNPMDLRA